MVIGLKKVSVYNCKMSIVAIATQKPVDSGAKRVYGKLVYGLLLRDPCARTVYAYEGSWLM